MPKMAGCLRKPQRLLDLCLLRIFLKLARPSFPPRFEISFNPFIPILSQSDRSRAERKPKKTTWFLVGSDGCQN